MTNQPSDIQQLPHVTIEADYAEEAHEKNKNGTGNIHTNNAVSRKLSDNGLTQLSLVANQFLTGAGNLRSDSCSTTTAAEEEESVHLPKADNPIVSGNNRDANNTIRDKNVTSDESSDNNPPLALVIGADLSAWYGPVAMAQPPTFYGFIKDEIDAALVVEAVVCGERRALQLTPEPSFVRIVHGTVICIESSSFTANDSNALFIRDGGVIIRTMPRWSAPIQQGKFTIQMELDHSVSSTPPATSLFPKRNGICKKFTTVVATNGRIFNVVSYFYPSDVIHFYTGKDLTKTGLLRQSIVPLRIPSRMSEFSESLAKITHYYVPDGPTDICDEFYTNHGHPIYHITKQIAVAVVVDDDSEWREHHDLSNNLENTRRNKKLRIDSLLL
ncbi:hypothetical protein HK100_005382 [Physocladia obscura]|uniref:Uncharacterized protein n=1 Tax=Physocladia obscura TaxID=109957 RepID=A0AAD5STY5_9FUNG|nr:hypothetical protein HK100_005382 [Physocladia obscura]